MTITWRRLGFLGFIIPLVFWAIAERGWDAPNTKAIRVAFLLAAVTVWFIGTRLNAGGPDEDGKAKHLVFGLPLQWPVVPVAGLLITFV